MRRQFTNKICILCQERPSSPSGEHVWTEWFLSEFPESDGPYRRYINGEPERKRDGVTIRTHSSAERVKVPCCTDCNAILQRRFENAAKPIVRRTMKANGAVMLSSAEATVFGLWLVKTWLLLAHPVARRSLPGPSPRTWKLEETPDDRYSWMITELSPPAGLSLWLAVEEGDLPGPDEPRHLPLPTVVADGRTTRFQAFRCSIRSLDVSLAYHPGWDIAHPMEGEGRAVRLWPPRHVPVDLGSLPRVASRDTAWVDGPTLHFAPGSYDTECLPPIDGSQDLLFSGLPGVMFAAAPRLGGAR